MSTAVITVTDRKVSITKSRSGHYTASVTEVGTWTLPGISQIYPHAKRVLHETKLELSEARALIRQHSMPTEDDSLKQTALGNSQQALMVAITHLDKVLNGCRTASEQQRADTAAREWLASIGAT